MTPRNLWRERLIELSREAGRAIMQVYAQDFAVDIKGDKSPVTAADLAAHRIICDGLAAMTPDIPVLSEEAADIPWERRREWHTLWLVDPLDGTREFVKKNGEFTVNIALIENHEPTMGIIYAPALDVMVHAERSASAWLRDGDEDIALASTRPAAAPLRVAASRSHNTERTQRLLDALGEHERVGLGSSLKFCRLAEGRMDFYPRFGPTSEWDTAAGQIILEAAGGAVYDLQGRPLRYNTKDSLLNPDFFAVGDPGLGWRGWVA
jgi:3'(2'), 5'-bisphosphate nucleotidase